MGVVGSERSPTCSTGTQASRQSCEEIRFHDAWKKHAAEYIKSGRCQEDVIVLFWAYTPHAYRSRLAAWRRFPSQELAALQMENNGASAPKSDRHPM